MKITEVETVLVDKIANLVYVRIHTDEGIIGLGETFFAGGTVRHGSIPPLPLLVAKKPAANRPPLAGHEPVHRASTARAWRTGAAPRWTWPCGTSSGMRQARPPLLGGATRERVRVYNASAGYRYVRRNPAGGSSVSNWGLGQDEGPYEDLDVPSCTRADELGPQLAGAGDHRHEDLALGSVG